ncbi:hypothetical protein BDZ45DRAFT_352092 [Acephala macrosclerotiorum]|nr:hypothetical protein BDZ45DRAFT_352092 [Acephala macrosclerotiorum]
MVWDSISRKGKYKALLCLSRFMSHFLVHANHCLSGNAVSHNFKCCSSHARAKLLIPCMHLRLSNPRTPRHNRSLLNVPSIPETSEELQCSKWRGTFFPIRARSYRGINHEPYLRLDDKYDTID